MRRYIVTLLFSISVWVVKLYCTNPKIFDNNFTLYSGDILQPIHYHGSHASHCSHHSHYSCMLNKADSIGSVSLKSQKFIRDNIQKDYSASLIKTFKAKAIAESGYDGKNGFKGEALFIVVKYDYSGKPHYKQYQVRCMAIPLTAKINNYYIYYEDFDSKDEMDLFVNSIGETFLSKEHMSGYKERELDV